MASQEGPATARKVGEGFGRPDADAELPLDIAYNKLTDWLVPPPPPHPGVNFPFLVNSQGYRSWPPPWQGLVVRVSAQWQELLHLLAWPTRGSRSQVF